MPYSCTSNIDDYLDCLSCVNSIMTNFPTPYAYAIGDFNSDTMQGHQHLFGKELLQFCTSEGYTLSDHVYLSSDSFTFHSSAHGSVSWLDHVITTSSGHEIIKGSIVGGAKKK